MVDETESKPPETSGGRTLEARVAALEKAMALMVGTWLPAVRAQLETLSAPPALGGRGGQSRNHSNWRDLVICRTLHGTGLSIRKVSMATGVPYTTCHNYCYMSDERAALLKEQWEDGNPPFGVEDVDLSSFTG